MKKLLYVLMVLTCFLVIVGCGQEGGSENTNLRTVQDVAGTDVQIPAQINRVADLWHANNQIVLLLGGADKLVVTTQNVQKLPWFAQVYPRILQIPAPVKGTDIQLEEIQKAKPDVVLASNKKQIEAVKNVGIPAVWVEFQDYEGLRKVVNVTANVLGGDAPKRGADYIAYLDRIIKDAENRTKQLTDDQRPSVLHIVGGDDLTKVDGSHTIIDEWIRYGGGRNAIAEKGPQINVTMEEIIKANPDVIIIGGTQSRKGIEAIKNDPKWANINAVKNGRLYSNPVGTFNWDRYSAESALQILWAGQILQPELFKDINLVKATQDFYKDFLHYDLSSVDAQRIIDGLAPAK